MSAAAVIDIPVVRTPVQRLAKGLTFRNPSHNPSRRTARVIGEFNREWLKRHAIKIVKVRTSDLEIPLGYLIRDDSRAIRVGYCDGYLSGRDVPYQFARKQKWVVVEIDKTDLESLEVRS